jgi:putative transport protein
MVIVGRFFLKINYLQLVGIMSGSYTDPAALSFSTNYLDSDIPIQSYAQVYPLVTIARIFTASILILLLT